MDFKGVVAPYGVKPVHFFVLVILQCLLQGSLLSILASFFGSRSINQRPQWFKAYVLLVNGLSLTQTVLTLIQGFELFNSTPPTRALRSAFMIMTTIIGVLVQSFFIYRCWRIFNKRILPIIPLIALMATSLVSGLLAESFGYQGSRAGSSSMTSSRIALIICLSCSFVIDASVTTTTIVFIWRTRTGLREHIGVFNTIWKIMWTSAAPPLILLTISIINGYIIRAGSQPLTVIVGGITAKFCNFSLMANLLGQDLIRRKLERSSPELPTISTSRTGDISEPVFAISMASLDPEHAQVPAANLANRLTSHINSSVNDYGEGSDTSSTKPEKSAVCPSTHQVRFLDRL